MILLDTDHLTILGRPSSDRRNRLVARLAAAIDEEIGTTIVNVEEQMRGWLAVIARERQVVRQVGAYRELAALLDFFTEYCIALFDEEAVRLYESMRGLRVGTMDLKIASISIASNALLLTTNRSDFENVPGLRFENWMD